MGRPCKVSEEVEDWIIEFLHDRPYTYLLEVAFEVEVVYGVKLSEVDLSRLTKRL